MTKALSRGQKRPQSVSDYIAAYPKKVQQMLREMRRCLSHAAPGAAESLKWGMPAFSDQRILFTYAAFKGHLSLYPTPSVVKAFASSLTAYKTSGSTIQFPLDRPLPLALVRKIALFRVRESREKDAKWM
jgi:uncharacterized protein YdhG (YjbR/CyaY superfamily)